MLTKRSEVRVVMYLYPTEAEYESKEKDVVLLRLLTALTCRVYIRSRWTYNAELYEMLA